MLCAGVVHGDLSEFNILVSGDGPVIIDLPQAVDAAGNNHAQAMLARDVNNLKSYFGQFAPALLATRYAEEIWALYKHGNLHPEVELTGLYECALPEVDLEGVMREIDDTLREEEARLLRLQELG
jgi:RIO kinase 1